MNYNTSGSSLKCKIDKVDGFLDKDYFRCLDFHIACGNSASGATSAENIASSRLTLVPAFLVLTSGDKGSLAAKAANNQTIKDIEIIFTQNTGDKKLAEKFNASFKNVSIVFSQLVSDNFFKFYQSKKYLISKNLISSICDGENVLDKMIKLINKEYSHQGDTGAAKRNIWIAFSYSNFELKSIEYDGSTKKGNTVATLSVKR